MVALSPTHEINLHAVDETQALTDNTVYLSGPSFTDGDLEDIADLMADRMQNIIVANEGWDCNRITAIEGRAIRP